MNDNIYIEEDEIVPVETQTEFIKEFDTSNLNEGEYKIFVKLDYLGQTEPAEAQETFIIKKGIIKRPSIPFLPISFLYL